MIFLEIWGSISLPAPKHSVIESENTFQSIFIEDLKNNTCLLILVIKRRRRKQSVSKDATKSFPQKSSPSCCSNGGLPGGWCTLIWSFSNFNQKLESGLGNRILKRSWTSRYFLKYKKRLGLWFSKISYFTPEPYLILFTC